MNMKPIATRAGAPVQRHAERDPNRLAILGGQPMFGEPLHVGRPNIGKLSVLQEHLRRICDSRWLTNAGPLVQEFEDRVAQQLGVKHCVAVCNATIGLELAAGALRLSGEVIMPAFTFVATAHALRWQGIKPVFCDIDPRTHNLDPERVERLISPNTTGIVGVHVWGRPCAVEALEALAERYSLALFFDSAHAFGCTYRGHYLGNFGRAEVFSFHATKILNCGEGGAVTTNDDQLAGRLRLLKNFGFSGRDRVVALGINGKMSELAAAMGLTNLDAIDDFVAANCANYHRYRAQLESVPGISCVAYDERERCNYQYVVIEWDESTIGISRDEAVAALEAENILARRYFYPGVHRMEPYRTEEPYKELRLPETEWVASRTVTLPTGSAIAPETVDVICGVVRAIVGNAAPIRDRLSGLVA